MNGWWSMLLVLAACGLGPGLWAPGVARAEEENRSAARPISGSWLGVWLSDAVDGGAQVLALAPRGPASSAGVQAGDTILEANGRPIADDEELSRLLEQLEPGETVQLGLLRAGQTIGVQVRLGSRPRVDVPVWSVLPEIAPPPVQPAPPVQYHLAYGSAVGLQVASITPALRRHYGAPEDSGVLVTKVEAGRLAERSGLRVGDVIVRIGEHDVESAAQIRGRLVTWSSEQPIEIAVVRDGTPIILTKAPERSAAADALAAARASRARTVRRKIELEIERLERRLHELREELERLDERAP